MNSLKIDKASWYQGIAVTLPFVLFYGCLLLAAHFSTPTATSNEHTGISATLDPAFNPMREHGLKKAFDHYQEYQRVYQKLLKQERLSQDGKPSKALLSYSRKIDCTVGNYNLIAEQTNNSVFIETGLPRHLPSNDGSLAAQ